MNVTLTFDPFLVVLSIIGAFLYLLIGALVYRLVAYLEGDFDDPIFLRGVIALAWPIVVAFLIPASVIYLVGLLVGGSQRKE